VREAEKSKNSTGGDSKTILVASVPNFLIIVRARQEIDYSCSGGFNVQAEIFTRLLQL